MFNQAICQLLNLLFINSEGENSSGELLDVEATVSNGSNLLLVNLESNKLYW